MAIETDDDARFLAEKIRDGTLTGDRKEAAFLALQEFRSDTQSGESGGARAKAAKTILGIPETALELATGLAAQVPAGLAGIVASIVPGGPTGPEAIERASKALTFQPRTEAGKTTSELVGRGFEALDLAITDIAAEDAPIQTQDFGAPITTGDEGVDAALRGSSLASTFIKTAILGAPLAFGLRTGLTKTRPAAKPTPRQQVAASAAEEGYVTTPSVRGEGGVAGTAEGLGGIIKTKQIAIEKNQAVTNSLANRAVGLPAEVPLSVEILQGVRSQAAAAYENIRGVGKIITDNRFKQDLSKAVGQFKNAARDFPELAKTEVINIVESLRKPEFRASTGIDAIGLLRNKADVAFRQGDKALGNSYRAASNAMETVIERHLGRGSDAGLLDSFRQARQQIAITYTVQKALQGRITGDINASVLASELRKGKPLTGDLRTIADFANAFPDVSTLFKKAPQAFSPLDLAVGGGSLGLAGTATAFGAGPAALIPLVGTVARPLLRKGALSDVARRSGFPSATVRPTAAIQTGGALSAVLASQDEQ